MLPVERRHSDSRHCGRATRCAGPLRAAVGSRCGGSRYPAGGARQRRPHAGVPPAARHCGLAGVVRRPVGGSAHRCGGCGIPRAERGRVGAGGCPVSAAVPVAGRRRVALAEGLVVGARASLPRRRAAARVAPGCPSAVPSRRPPGLVGGRYSRRARPGRTPLRRWIPYSTRLDYAAGLVALRSAASYAGRDADDVTPAMYLTVLVDDDAERGHRAAEEWCLRWYELPFEMVSSVQAFVIGSAAGVAARIARYVEAGAATSSSVWRRSTLRRTWLWSPTWCCAPNSPVEPARWWIRARRPRRRIGRHRRPRRTAGATDDLTGNEGLARSAI